MKVLKIRVRKSCGGSCRPVHLIGLLGDGGVHSSQDTLFVLLRMAKREVHA